MMTGLQEHAEISGERRKVQVAFQGGGAKLCDLIAAAHGFQELSKDIQVTRVSGTSAGAIVAGLFSRGIPMQRVREYLRQNGGKHLR